MEKKLSLILLSAFKVCSNNIKTEEKIEEEVSVSQIQVGLDNSSLNEQMKVAISDKILYQKFKAKNSKLTNINHLAKI